MKNDFFQPTIKLTWKCKIYNCSKKANRTISERVSALSDIQEGSIFETITELDYIRRYIQSHSDKKMGYNAWHSKLFNSPITDDVIAILTKNKYDKMTDSIKCFVAAKIFGWMAFQIRKRSIEYLKGNDNISLSEFQSKISVECKRISQLFLFYLSSSPSSAYLKETYAFWDEVQERIGADGVRDLQDYIEAQKYRKVCCFLPSKELPKLVAFSGYQDCDDTELYKIIKGESISDYTKRQTKLYNDICSSISAKLITTNVKICYFGEEPINKPEEYNPKILETFGDAVADVISGKQERKAVEGRYSCCERKLFSKFNNYINDADDGELFVNSEPCKLCKPAIKYYQEEFGCFIVVFPWSA